MNPIVQKMNSQGDLNDIIQMAKGNPQGVFNNMLKNNPQFARFVKECEGKSPDQIAKEHGIDFGMIRQLLR